MLLIYNSCPLYTLTSKKMLKFLLNIQDNRLLNQAYVLSLIDPYIDSKGKPRLIEAPRAELKIVQKKIKRMLSKICVPDNIFSGIKGRSYADNAKMHIDGNLRYLFKIDLSSFFPSIKRETVYRFFKEDLKCSPDVAEILTNFTTVDISKTNASDLATIYSFLERKNVKSFNHLISGAPTSQILSYLVNHNMFTELQVLSKENGIDMTVYVDDITFSSKNYISHRFKEKVFRIIKKYNYQISYKKVKSYSKLYPKLITGVIVNSSGNVTIKNSLRKKIISEHNHLRDNPNDIKSRLRLRGLITAARQVDKTIYPTIYKFAFSNE